MRQLRQPRIIVLGSANTDLVLQLPHLPRPGETVLGGVFMQVAGGKGANQAVAAARAGLGSVTFLAAVGNDDFGQQAIAAYASDGIDCSHLKRIEREATGTALILVDRTGENMIGVASGANSSLTPEDLDRIPEEVFRSARVFLASLETPLATVIRGLERARAAGMLTILNPAPANRALSDPQLLRLVDILTPNEGEAAALAGMRPLENTNLEQQLEQARIAATTIRQQGAAAVIVTLGSAGCFLCAERQLHVPGRQVKAVDATAAGDAFNGALAVALADGKTLSEAAAWANRAAALAVTRAGAQPSLATRAEIEQNQ